MSTEVDLVAIGRVSVDLYGQQIGGRLEDVASFAKGVGGCPANVAIGAARLGLRCARFEHGVTSAPPASPLGSTGHSRGSSMRIGVGLTVLALGAFGVWRFAHSGAPSATQVEPLLRTYLESASKCQGDFDLQLDNVSVGPYVSQFGGWPVYADHVEKCEGKISGFANSHLTTSYDGSHDAEKQVAAAFVRRSFAGRLELYVPEIFQAGQREMQQFLQKSLDNIKVN